MNITTTASPVSLSYVASLRGVTPRQPGAAFAYLNADCQNPERAVCLAASNPEGTFFALAGDASLCKQGEDLARLRSVSNITFLNGTPSRLLTQLEKGEKSLPAIDFLVADETQKTLSPAEQGALFALAEKMLTPSGIFHYAYQAYDTEDGALKFLVNEFAPEMNAEQAKSFLGELKILGKGFFEKNPQAQALLDGAMAKGVPDEFFSAYEQDGARSKTFDTIVALRPRGLMYVGDAQVSSNYVQLSVSPEAAEIIEGAAKNHLYEPIKDFAINRQVRSDVWCRQTAPLSSNLAELFGGFAYGITVPSEDLPSELKVAGAVISLASPLYANLISLLSMMPATIGDFLAHATGRSFESAEVVSAIHLLVACGLARPMRGVQAETNVVSVMQSRLVGSFNQYLDKMIVNEGELWLASVVLGDAVRLSSREALVMQALGRTSLANSVSALLPEMQRLAKDSALATELMGTSQATPEAAQGMIQDVISKSIVQWYAYGLMEAA